MRRPSRNYVDLTSLVTGQIQIQTLLGSAGKDGSGSFGVSSLYLIRLSLSSVLVGVSFLAKKSPSTSRVESVKAKYPQLMGLRFINRQCHVSSCQMVQYDQNAEHLKTVSLQIEVP